MDESSIASRRDAATAGRCPLLTDAAGATSNYRCCGAGWARGEPRQPAGGRPRRGSRQYQNASPDRQPGSKVVRKKAGAVDKSSRVVEAFRLQQQSARARHSAPCSAARRRQHRLPGHRLRTHELAGLQFNDPPELQPARFGLVLPQRDRHAHVPEPALHLANSGTGCPPLVHAGALDQPGTTSITTSKANTRARCPTTPRQHDGDGGGGTMRQDGSLSRRPRGSRRHRDGRGRLARQRLNTTAALSFNANAHRYAPRRFRLTLKPGV